MTRLIILIFPLLIFLSGKLSAQEKYAAKLIRKNNIEKVEVRRTLVPGKSGTTQEFSANDVLGKHLVRTFEFDAAGRVAIRRAFANFYNEESNVPDDKESMDEKYPWYEQHIYNDAGQLFQKIAFPERDSSRKVISTYLYDEFGNVSTIMSNVRKPQVFNHFINPDNLIARTEKPHSNEVVSFFYNKKKQLIRQVELIPQMSNLAKDTITTTIVHQRKKRVATYYKKGKISHKEITHFDCKKRIVKRELFLQTQKDPIQINFYSYNKMGLIEQKIISNKNYLTTVEFLYFFRN